MVGARIAAARERAGQTQGGLAERIGIPRTSMVRLESGERQLGALEAVAIADALKIRLTLLVYPPLGAVASRRSDAAPSHHSTLVLDEALEVFARDVANLAGDGVLEPGNSRRWPHLRCDDDAERMATQVREQVSLGAEVTLDVGAVAEAFGMVTLSVPLGGEGADGAMVSVADGVAAAVINGDKRQG